MASITTATATGPGSGSLTGQPLSSAQLTVHSQEVLFEATPLLRFDQVAVRKEELGVVQGRTIQFLRYNALTGSATLTENVDMTVTNLSASEIQITVAEFGFAVAVSELLLRSSFDDVMSRAARQLGRHYATTQDGQFRDVLLGSSNVLYAGNKTRTTLTAADTFDTRLIKDAVELLSTNKTPRIGDAYVCYIHPHQGRTLRDDPAWINAKNYAAPEEILRGEVGRFENVRFIETTQTPWILASGRVVSGGADAGSVFVDGADSGVNRSTYNATTNVYQAIIVGDHALGHAVSYEVEMRDNGVQDFGRKHHLAWYGIYGQDFIEDGHAVVLETA